MKIRIISVSGVFHGAGQGNALIEVFKIPLFPYSFIQAIHPELPVASKVYLFNRQLVVAGVHTESYNSK
jgi:hypothetical protein